MFVALPPFPTCMILGSVDVGRFATLPNCGILVSVDVGRFAILPDCGILVSCY